MKDKINLYRALDKVNFGAIDESGKNSHQRYDYAKLKDLYNAVKGPLKKEGLKINHNRFCLEDNTIIQRTTLVHLETGEHMNDDCIIVPDSPGVQKFSAACTYIKKMAIKNLCGIDTGEDDDDGESGERYREELQDIKQLIKASEDPKALWGVLSLTYDIKSLEDIQEKDIRNIRETILMYKK